MKHETVNDFLYRVTDGLVTDACKKVGHTELYKSDVVKFLLAINPVDRVNLIDMINRADRDATLEWARMIDKRTAKLDQADGLLATIQAEHEGELNG